LQASLAGSFRSEAPALAGTLRKAAERRRQPLSPLRGDGGGKVV